MRPRSVLADSRWILACATSFVSIALGLPTLAKAATRLTTAADASGDIFSFVENGTYAVAWDRPDLSSVSHLLGVPIDGSAPAVILNDPAVSPAGQLSIRSYALKRNDHNVVVFYGPNAATPSQGNVYYNAPVTGDSPASELTPVEQRISFDVRTFESDFSYEYVVHADTSGINQVYRAPLLGAGNEIELTGHTRSGVNIPTPTLVSASNRVLYLADADVT